MTARPVSPPETAPTPRLALVALVVAVLLAGFLAIFPNPDRDIWYHLKTGELIATTHTIPRHDVFTYTAEGRPWITHEWLAEVIFYELDRLGGFDLLIVFKAVLAALAVTLASVAALVGPRWRERVGWTAVGALLAGPLLATRAFIQPHMFTAALLGATLLLLRLESVTGRRVWRFGLVPVFVLWANLHSGFVLGFLLVGLYYVGDGRRHRDLWRGRLVIVPILVAATLLNPHHVHALLYPLHLVVRGEVTEGIAELQSIFHPNYRGALFQYDLALVVIALAVLLLRDRKRIVWSVVLPGVVFLALAVQHMRGLMEFAVLVPVLLGMHGAWPQRATQTGLAFAVLAITAIGVPLDFAHGVPMGRSESRRPGLGVTRDMDLAEVVSFLKQVDVPGRMFNLLGYGGYLIDGLWPQRKVYIDGRLEVFPPGFLAAYGKLLSTGEGWDDLCRTWDITLAVVDYHPGPRGDYGLWKRLRDDPTWERVFTSHATIVYARHVPENAALLARFGCPFDPPRVDAETIASYVKTARPQDVARSVAAIEQWTGIAPHDAQLRLALGNLLVDAGRPAEGAAQLRQAGPGIDTRLYLVLALTRADSLTAARQEVDHLLEDAPGRLETWLLLAEIQQKSGDLDAAFATLDQAARSHPADARLSAARRALEAIAAKRHQ